MRRPSSPTFYWDRGIRFFDINGDGLPDFVRSYHTDSYIYSKAIPVIEIGTTKVILLNTGNGWATSTAYTLPDYITQGHQVGGYFQGYEYSTNTPTGSPTASCYRTS